MVQTQSLPASVVGWGASFHPLCSTMSKRNQFWAILLTAEPNEANLGMGWWGWGGQGEEVSL